MQRVMPVLQKGNACKSTSVTFSNVSSWGVVKKPVVSFITSIWTELLGFTPVSMMSWSYTNVTQPMAFHNISTGVCRSLFWNSRHDASLCEPEQHKQLCTPSKVLLCPSPVPGPLPESFAKKSVAKDEVCLRSGGTLVLLGGFFLFALVSMGGMVITPANPGSFLIAACRLTNLARSSRPGFCPVGIRYVSALVDRVVGKSSDDELHIPPEIFWRHTGVVPDL